MSDRRSISFKEYVPLAVLLINVCALVWGAARLSKSVDDLQASVVDLRVTTRGLVTDIAGIKIDYNARIRVLEDENARRK